MSRTQQIGDIGSDQSLSPPDVQMAVGPTYIVEMLNSSGSVWTKSGSLVRTFDLNTFYALSANYRLVDPNLLYDAMSQRWFASGIAYDYSSHNSMVDVAVSQTSDPTGAWYFYTVESNTSGTLYDQPKLGVSNDKVVLSWNNYANGSSFTGTETWILEKSDVLARQTYTWKSFGPDASSFNYIPTRDLSATSDEYLLSNLGSQIVLVTLSGTPAQNDVSWNSQYLSVSRSTSYPPSAVQPSGGTIETNDDRLITAVWQNGTLWTGSNDTCTPSGDTASRACLRLAVINTSGSSATLAQNFDVGILGADLYFPAVTLDSLGNAFVTCTESSATLNPTAMAAVQLLSDPTNSLEGFTMIEAGQGYYADGVGNRWGDYSGAATDAADPTRIWLASEYVASGAVHSDWGTGAIEMHAPAIPATPTSTPTPIPAATATPNGTPPLTIHQVYLPFVQQ